ncbi:MAG: hypothetical protein GXO34_04335, partial [Deltaproteobacteria bacterium]|nr:hypothetical protein [Deltaproteobacteria bacterium]
MSRTSAFRPWLPVLAAVLLILLPLISCKTAPRARKPRKGCLDCHPEMAKQFRSGVIHQPLEKGRCRDCHRPHGLVGGIYLKLPTPNLCYKCHKKLAQDLNRYPAANRHQPVGRGHCKTCHDPHNAPNPGLLPKSEVELCYGCHDAEQFTRAWRHQPLEKGCLTCHDPHGGEFPALLAQPPAELCRRCHDFSQTSFREKHGNYPITDNCLDCHDPHSAANRNLLKKFVHEPVSAGRCSDCHQPATAATPF